MTHFEWKKWTRTVRMFYARFYLPFFRCIVPKLFCGERHATTPESSGDSQLRSHGGGQVEY